MKKYTFLICILCIFSLCFTITGCSEASKNDMKYWFSKNEVRFVEYDNNANSGSGNINEAGTYWEMTVKKDVDITISLRNNSLGLYSTTYLYINDIQVKADTDDWYEFVFKNLSLKKGDKLVFHAFWINSLATDSKGFEMSIFTISDGTGDYIINDINK